MAARLSPEPPLLQLAVAICAEAEEAASRIMEDLFGQWPVSYSEPESTCTELSLYFPPAGHPTPAQLADLNVQLRLLAASGIHTGPPRIRSSLLTDRHWKESWKRHFKPLEIGGRLLLRPSWSQRRAKPGQFVVVLDPGLSFGTGQHPTTAFCLRELVKARQGARDLSLLDMGTGSGILAIAAAKLGYRPVHGFDHDPVSVRVALKNARRNGVENRLRLRREDLTRLPSRTTQTYDVVCANLLADLLTAQVRTILNRVTPGGVLILAGILEKEFDEVERHYVAMGAQPLRTRAKGEWRSGSYRILP